MTSTDPAATGTRRRRSADERRAEIADAARALALEEGLSGVTLRAVAARVGVASGLVAHYEPSMDALIARTFTRIVGDELDGLRALTAQAPDAVAAVRMLLGLLLEGTHDAVTRVWVQSWGLGGEVLGAAVRAAMDDWEGYLEQLVDAGVAAGRFRVVAGSRAVAVQMLGMIDGLNAHALVRWREPADRRALMALSVEAMLGLDRGALDER
ncbi:TetR family transcriptional regulator [Microbacterium sp. W1N]|uniref:TetR/AcrR family transcriptional regulator n=1 Tax=Microbacterium festucae TaxID=2977531 RepID=UPI0021C18B74|nr:TetR family transcriptional regulator [Microbacterium festucae]MCT9819571.1 TetR family transcriptional regulator [Microbacterium festucae]